MATHPSVNGPVDMLRAALDGVPKPVLIYGSTHILYANQAACVALGGANPSLLQGMPVQDFILPELADVSDPRRAYVLEHGIELRNLVVKVRRLDGEPTVFRLDIVPISFDGTVAAMATLARD